MGTIYALSRNTKISERFYLTVFIFLSVQFSINLNRRVFVTDNRFIEVLLYSKILESTICTVINDNLKSFPWKQRTHKRTKIGDSVLLRLLVYRNVVTCSDAASHILAKESSEPLHYETMPMKIY